MSPLGAARPPTMLAGTLLCFVLLLPNVVLGQCSEFTALGPLGPTDFIDAHPLQIFAAHGSFGPAEISIIDCYPPLAPDGALDLVIPWTEPTAVPRAQIVFPVEFFGAGVTRVDILGSHGNTFIAEAHGASGVVATASHTAGQGNLQNLVLVGANPIRHVVLTGSEICIVQVCWQSAEINTGANVSGGQLVGE